jgi:hypothetical protein
MPKSAGKQAFRGASVPKLTNNLAAVPRPRILRERRSPGAVHDRDSPKEHIMGDYRDIQNGVNDPVNGVDVRWRIKPNVTAHERAQTAADVRAVPSPDSAEEFLPEALRRAPAPPLNKRTGRNPTD